MDNFKMFMLIDLWNIFLMRRIFIFFIESKFFIGYIFLM